MSTISYEEEVEEESDSNNTRISSLPIMPSANRENHFLPPLVDTRGRNRLKIVEISLFPKED